DGDSPDLAALVRLKTKYGAWLMVDEAHSLGVLGPTGRGIGEHAGVARADVDLWMGTLSKSLASAGGYIAGRAPLVEYLKYTVPGSIFSAGLPPPSAAAALAALRVMVREPERVRRVQRNAQRFLAKASSAGLDTGGAQAGALVPVIVATAHRAVVLSDAL